MPTGNVLFHGLLPSLKVSALILLYLYALFLPVGAAPKNISIDDQNGDERTGVVPVFAPPSEWAHQDCGGCKVVPDQNLLFEHTATAATFRPDMGFTSNTVDFDFTGTAIYIFFTLFYNEGLGITVNTECNFILDGEAPVFFNHSGDPTAPPFTKRDYQIPVFSRTGLENKAHHMQIRMSDVLYHVFLSFDYAQYTIEEVDVVSSNPITSQAGPPTTLLPSSSSPIFSSQSPSPTSSSSSPSSSSQSSLSLSSFFQSSSSLPSSSQSSSSFSSSSQSSLSPSSSATSPASEPLVGAILGGILGGLAFLVIFLGLLWTYCHRNNRLRSGSPGPAARRPFLHSFFTSSAVSSTRQTRRTVAQSKARPTASPAIKTSSSTQTRNIGEVLPSSSKLPSQTPSGSNGQVLFVKRRLQDAHRCLQTLTAEVAVASPRSTTSRTTSSRIVNVLMEEVRGLRREVQMLERSQGSSLDPPPQYDE